MWTPVGARAGVKDEIGHDFRELQFLFTGLLFPANMPQDLKWLPRSRLWRFILLQARAGPFKIRKKIPECGA